MNKIQKILSETQNVNFNVDQCWYVPNPTIDRIASKATITEVVQANDLLSFEEDQILSKALRESLVEDIHNTAKVIFTISCYLGPSYLRRITRVIRYARGKSTEADRRLPFSQDQLLECAFDKNAAKKFFEVQWHFIAPNIRLGALDPVEFDPNAILPLRLNKAARDPLPDTGFFGVEIKEVCIEEGHRVGSKYKGRTVRKKLRPEASRESFQRELRNLCILSSARHENIVQLLSAYIHVDEFYLIFPLASHGSLAQLFESNNASSWAVVKSEEMIVMALSGLASALVTMHKFTTEDLNLIGCHRDLKPANILVEGERLVLADFGLSRFVDSRESSSSTGPNIMGDFIAPEHESIDKDFARNPIGRASDIWAFGCVMLMMLEFSLHGKKGLEKFQKDRRIQRDECSYIHYCFHDFDKINPSVEPVLKKLQNSSSLSSQGLAYLIKKMLVVEKEMRPGAAAVDEHIRSLVVHMLSNPIEEQFDKACIGENKYILYERARFMGWRLALRVEKSQLPAFLETQIGESYSDFKVAVEHLQKLKRLLIDVNKNLIDQKRKALLPVASCIDHLWEALKNERRTTAVAYTESILFEREHRGDLQELKGVSEKNRDKRTKAKAETKRELLHPSDIESSHVNYDALEPQPRMGTVIKVRIVTNGGYEPRRFIAEETQSFKRYQVDMARAHHAKRLLSRLQETANLLNVSADSKVFRVLRCRGYYHHPSRYRSGLLYEMPSVSHGKLGTMITLHEMLKKGGSILDLGDRFRLAFSLANAVYELHTVSWLHRNISASSVVFFCEKDGDAIDPQSFYFLGFAQSRPDKDLTHSDGPVLTGSDERSQYYQHPKHLLESEGFQMQHDYHALGMVLLEIGLWKLLPSVCGDQKSSSELRAIAKNELAPGLGISMGLHYRNAVLDCLGDKLSVDSTVRGDQKVHLLFRAQVVEELGPRYCRA